MTAPNDPLAGNGGDDMREAHQAMRAFDDLPTEPDPRLTHEEIVAKYPGGLNGLQFRDLTLASADADGRVDPPSLADWFAAQSMLMRMEWDGLLERRVLVEGKPGRRCTVKDAGAYCITDKGRSAMAAAAAQGEPG